MLDDSDVHWHRQIKSCVGGSPPPVTGDPAVFVSVSAAHQGPDGGGPVAAIVDLGVASRPGIGAPSPVCPHWVIARLLNVRLVARVMLPASRWGGGHGPISEVDPPDATLDSRTQILGVVRTASLAMGGSNQSLFLMGALCGAGHRGGAPARVGLLLGLAAMPGWMSCC